MIEIGKHDRSEINVVVSVLWAIDDDRTLNSVTVLSRVVSVIPGRSIKLCFEGVREALPGCNRTLGECRYAIHPLTVML